MRTSVVCFVVLSALAVLVVNADDTCHMLSPMCVAPTNECVADFIETPDKCVDNARCCVFPYHCINGTCRIDSQNLACKLTTDCKTSFYSTGVYQCVDGVCVVQGNFNDYCVNNTHCAGEMVCKSAKCQGRNKTMSCTDAVGVFSDRTNFQCDQNLTCILGVCVEAANMGAACTTSSNCDVYSICNDGKCTEPWSVATGGTCTDNNACEKDLYCNLVESKCKEATKPLTIKCEKDADCANYSASSLCSLCNSATGEKFCTSPAGVAVDCVAEMRAAFKCYRQKNCAPKPTSSLDSCAQLECTQETNAIFACESRCNAMKVAFGKKCVSSLLLRYCPLLATWIRIVIAFSILVTIITIVFVVYAISRCASSSKGYTSVNP